jgi:exonuclease SbcC
MKILAVRGKNLASLSGHFEVDFSKAPLDRAGLIAITGPTGAGKTTLLDAMCLALFDRTPRFANRGGVVIGGQEDDPTLGLRATDVRGILRHGASEGWAEVDFLGIDERRWRARWEVRRARGKTEGRLQPQQMQLLDPITGRVLVGDRKGDVLAAIEARLGLDFDQFRRSVLLAQGEFAAFLEASGGERAELLERMTGTGLYRQLGRAAYERAKQAEAELGLIRREHATLHILPDDARASLEATIATRRASAAELEHRRNDAEAALRWYGREAELVEALAAARTRAAADPQARAELADLERLLEQVERVEGIRERMAVQARWDAELAERSEELEFVRGDLPHIEAQLTDLRSRLAELDQARARARERRRRLAPELDRARELDGQAAATRTALERIVAKRTIAREQFAAGEQKLAQLDVALAQARERLEHVDAELAAHAGLEPIAEHWPHYKSLIQQQLRALQRRDKTRKRVAELEPRRDRCERELAEAKAELGEARKRKSAARQRLRKSERELDERASLADLRHRQHALERCRERVDELQTILRAAEQAEAQRRAIELERAELIVERDHRSAEQRRVEAELARAELGFDEAQRGLRRLEAVRDLVAHRVDLREGEACPLCGATEHPAAGEAAPVDSVVATQRERVRELLRSRDELQREQGEHQSRAQLASQRLALLDRRRTELERERDAAQASWTEQLGEGPLLPEPEDDDGSDANDEQLSLLGTPSGVTSVPARIDHADVGSALWSIDDQLSRRWTALAEERREVEARLEHQRDLQARREQADREFEDRRERLEAGERERDAVVRELDEAQTKLETLALELSEREAELEDVGPRALAVIDENGKLDGQSFCATLEHVGVELLAHLDAAVLEFRAGQGVRERTREVLREFESGRLEFASAHEARRERGEQLDAELVELDQTLAAQRSARAELLGGRSVAEVTRELEATVELADRDHDAGKDELARQEVIHGRLRTQLHSLTEQVDGLRRSRAEAARSVIEAQAEAGVDAAELTALLEREELWCDDWATTTRARIDAARAERERLQAIVGERERVLAAHREREPPTLAREAAEQLRGELGQAGEQLRRELFELEHQLRRDSEDRAEAEALAPRLAEREHAAVIWGRLRDAIGSATGDKFQKFAQSLTLELLLAQANAQLRVLKPRYALGRVPKHDLELQLVDHDLGDEIRSIRGLSGGEKFLVSLALALALASLSAEDCRIDSLFIDEGFGSLDAHSLDVAVSTLDTLQAEGRQIGVISHVPGLAERVGVEIRVEPVSSGRSRVRVIEPRRAAVGARP